MKNKAYELGVECHDFRRVAANTFRDERRADGEELYDANEETMDFLRHKRFSTTKRYLRNQKLKIVRQGKRKYKKGLTNAAGSGIMGKKDSEAIGVIDTERGARDVNGYRQSRHNVLTEKDIEHLNNEIDAIGADRSVFRFNTGNKTGFDDDEIAINVKGDVYPDLNSKHPRDLMSERAVLAHEYYGHYNFFPSQFGYSDWRDEMRASYIAALKAPNLSAPDRAYLMLDAYERAREAGHMLEYSKKAREIIYGYKY